jgi:hypothetical protein
MQTMKKPIAIATFFVILIFSSCNNNTPKNTADKFLTALYHYDYKTAKSLGTNDTKDMVGLLEAFSSNMTDSMRKAAKKIVVKIDQVIEKGDTAFVRYSLSDDSTQKTLHLVRQNKQWLVSWTKMDAEQEMNNEEEEAPVEETIDTTMNPEAVDDSANLSN